MQYIIIIIIIIINISAFGVIDSVKTSDISKVNFCRPKDGINTDSLNAFSPFSR